MICPKCRNITNLTTTKEAQRLASFKIAEITESVFKTDNSEDETYYCPGCGDYLSKEYLFAWNDCFYDKNMIMKEQLWKDNILPLMHISNTLMEALKDNHELDKIKHDFHMHLQCLIYKTKPIKK
jgi:hypothetical protein